MSELLGRLEGSRYRGRGGWLMLLFRAMPVGLVRAMFAAVAWLAWTLGLRRKVALEGLRTAFPELTEPQRWALGKRNYRHIARCSADFLCMPRLSREELLGLVDASEFESVQRAWEGGKGVVLTTCHFGNFELLGTFVAQRGIPITAVTRELHGAFNGAWVKTRAIGGLGEIHHGWDKLYGTVERGECLVLLIDQNMLPKRAIFVPFLGKLAATTPAPARVAERTGAPVFLGLMLCRPEGGYRFLVDGPFRFERKTGDLEADVRAFTSMLNERFERHVREHPEQWFWVHRRWKTRPPEQPAATSSAA